ncbi:hypothetical protein DUNSADRAFT_9028 [Dunaliella salina]|uniref:Encoded protein n=1 Tax=Dunaliella salina TaxID=3046 RepID=A0ABQ7GI94_DUNSA|nr:hypothetical protein DUNSADRAFT_9028 [Dunaliella salina]|eukprot:KAF5834327.1 hypothetical protein DUNSADRAFT_9028 [Dunaliella salina]
MDLKSQLIEGQLSEPEELITVTQIRGLGGHVPPGVPHAFSTVTLLKSKLSAHIRQHCPAVFECELPNRLLGKDYIIFAEKPDLATEHRRGGRLNNRASTFLASRIANGLADDTVQNRTVVLSNSGRPLPHQEVHIVTMFIFDRLMDVYGEGLRGAGLQQELRKVAAEFKDYEKEMREQLAREQLAHGAEAGTEAEL